MTFIDDFSDDGKNSILVFRQSKVPVFQNKVYSSNIEALQAPVADVELVQSDVSGFIFNKVFNPKLMQYDVNYQNEQANSVYFRKHLRSVLDLLYSLGLKGKKVIEVGCGKGVFFDLMLNEGIDCWGFDPTYEGNNPRINKDYFSEKFNDINADVIIMRHTLEHIPKPFSFIHTIAMANNYKGYLYVEVPTFDWIVEKRAFWDIFYEHCNYFTEQSLGLMFNNAVTGNLFGGQYIYLWADLSKLKSSVSSDVRFTRRDSLIFQDRLKYYQDFLKKHDGLAIWGAGAKSSTFLNLLDKGKNYIKYVVDINPAKQDKYVAGTGHPIFSPAILDSIPVQNILVMNENYLDEIEQTIGARKINIFNL